MTDLLLALLVIGLLIAAFGVAAFLIKELTK